MVTADGSTLKVLPLSSLTNGFTSDDLELIAEWLEDCVAEKFSEIVYQVWCETGDRDGLEFDGRGLTDEQTKIVIKHLKGKL